MPVRHHPAPTSPETVFTYAAPALKFGAGAADEVGADVARLGVTRVLLLTDEGVAATGAPERVAAALRTAGLLVGTYDGVRVEPTDASLREAAGAARESGPWEAFVAVGGGSVIDTAKAVNLLTTNPGDLADYLNPPVGAGRAPTRPLRPLVAVPTTAGTGSEATAVCVLDVLELHVKTGISHPALRPVLAVVDPLLSRTLPAPVTAASGLDVLCHALESWTARPFGSFERSAPERRVAYCGANPLSDLWALHAVELVGRSLRRAVAAAAEGRDDPAARGDMALAATVAGLGFGNAGVHVPHAIAYPVAGMVRDFRMPGYPDRPLVPHGVAVALTAPAAFRLTFPTAPERHLRAAALLDPDGDTSVPPEKRLPAVMLRLLRDVGVPPGLTAVGCADGDVDGLVAGAMRQQRLLAMAPCQVGPAELRQVITESLRW